MKAWSAALAVEVADWPRATARSFFGFNALYRGDNIFGMLPRTCSFGNGNLLAFRIDDAADRLKARLEMIPALAQSTRTIPAGSLSNSHPTPTCTRRSIGSAQPTRQRANAGNQNS
jgi:hypothetical protein